MPNFTFLQQYDKDIERQKIKRRNFSNFNEEKFLEDLNHDIATQPSLDDVNKSYNTLHDHLLNTIDKHAPLKTLSRKESKNLLKPWITTGIISSIKQRNRYYHVYIKSQQKTWYAKYKTYRDKINHLIRKSRNNYYKNYFSIFKNNSKKVWTGIKSIISNKKQRNSTINLQVNNQILNEFFINVGPNLIFQITIDIFQRFWKHQIQIVFFLHPQQPKKSP